jgi:hypothetical protein|eukprot:COSAG01_NODE_43_length_32320_cov_622.744763_25_plen_119_part_00
MNGTIGLDRYVSAVSEYNHRTMSTRMALALMGGLPACLPACLPGGARGWGRVPAACRCELLRRVLTIKIDFRWPAGASCCVGCWAWPSVPSCNSWATTRRQPQQRCGVRGVLLGGRCD